MNRPQVDILINNAGVAPQGSLAETRAEQFEQIVSVKLRSLFFITQGVVPLMPAGSRIINVGSRVTQTAFPGISEHSASKGFVDVLTLHLAAELGPRGINVNTVAPGVIDTRMNA